MSFSFDPTTDRGKVRLLCSDTNATYEIFSDASIDAFLSVAESNVLAAASLACYAIAADAGKSAISYNILNSNITIDRKQVPQYFRDLGDKYEARSKEQAGFSLDEWPLHIEPFSGVDRSAFSEDQDSDFYLLQDYQREGKG